MLILSLPARIVVFSPNWLLTNNDFTIHICFRFTGGTTRAQWEDVTGSTPLTFVNDCVNFTTTVSARFWLMDCRNIEEATKMATELYREAIHAPFMAKYVCYSYWNNIHCIYMPHEYFLYHRIWIFRICILDSSYFPNGTKC